MLAVASGDRESRIPELERLLRDGDAVSAAITPPALRADDELRAHELRARIEDRER